LIESGFLTNESDQRFLSSDAGQASMASSIYRAFKSYKAELETGIVSNNKIDEEDNVAEEKPDTTKNDNNTTTDNSDLNPRQDKKEVEDNSAIKVVDTTKTAKTDKKENTNPKVNQTPKTTAKSDIDYSNIAFITIQVGAVKEGGAISPKIKDLKTVFNITFDDGYTRYFVGRFSTIADAEVRLEKLKEAGFEDAFMTAYDHLVKVKCSEVQNKK
jgi:N-acetylmuramoyl-L-alanine amidase